MNGGATVFGNGILRSRSEARRLGKVRSVRSDPPSPSCIPILHRRMSLFASADTSCVDIRPSRSATKNPKRSRGKSRPNQLRRRSRLHTETVNLLEKGWKNIQYTKGKLPLSMLQSRRSEEHITRIGFATHDRVSGEKLTAKSCKINREKSSWEENRRGKGGRHRRHDARLRPHAAGLQMSHIAD